MATRKEVAEHLFMTPQNVAKLIKENVFVTQPGANPLDLEHCRRSYIAFLQNKARYHLKDGSGDITEEKTRLTKAQADKAELDVEVLEGKLIPTSLVADTWTNYISNCRAKLLGLPNKIAHLVIAVTDFADAEKIIKEAVNESLEELSKDGIPEEYRENTLVDKKDMESTS
ncbi:MAG: putative terminase small subunit [Prokaryotic dsDNA virus sp.]|nr:MAG: putative terminase small subunit [Prokaryotic dsDNA virus sp.]|tara:strand:+ start:61 stop:573 length:513 start_codon:yes stop_codon:yes gene_type:complete